jgi:type I restriction enzyme S subunit
VHALLARTAAARARLVAARRIVAQFRQAVLSAACSGRMTGELRATYPPSDPEVLNAATATDDNAWPLVPAAAACTAVQSGGTPANNPFTATGDVPFLKVYNIVNQQVAFDYKPQFITRSTHRSELKRSVVLPGDVLMNIVGPPLGKVALVLAAYPEWNINQALVLFRPKPFLSPEFLYYVLREGSEIRRIEADYRGSAGQSNISLSQSRAFLLPVPSPEEQAEIVKRIRAAFALADAVDRRLMAALARADRLPHAILTRAFTGQLTPTEAELARAEGRAYEPAEALLRRLATHRPSRAPKRRVRGSRAVGT